MCGHVFGLAKLYAIAKSHNFFFFVSFCFFVLILFNEINGSRQTKNEMSAVRSFAHLIGNDLTVNDDLNFRIDFFSGIRNDTTDVRCERQSHLIFGPFD